MSFHCITVSQINIVALEDFTIFYVNKQILDLLFRKFHDFEKCGLLLYEKALFNYKLHNIFRMRLIALARYLYFVKNEPELIKRVPLKYIGSYLNLTDSSTSLNRRNRK